MAARRLPLLPLRDIIVFPHQVVPLFVGRDKSIAALQEAIRVDKEVVLAAQTKAKTNEPGPDDIFPVGTLGHIVQLLHLPDGTVKVIVEGKQRVRLGEFLSLDPYLSVEVEPLAELAEPSDPDVEALMRSVRATFDTYVKLNKRIPHDTLTAVGRLESAARLADTIVGYLTLKLVDKQGLLELLSARARLERLHELMQAEIEILQVERKIRTRVKKQMEKTQKEYYLNEQMQAIQKELGERDELKNELVELEERIAQKAMPKDAQQRARQELKKLKMMPPMSAEATVVRNYIDWILALPWSDLSEDNLDLDHAEQVLDEDHYGLKKPKERIIEYLAVQALVKAPKGPILCLVGRRAWARPRWPRAWRGPWGASSSVCRWAACATRPRSAATAARTSARCPASSSTRSSAPAPPTPSSCSTRSTRCRPTSAVTRPPRCSRCWTPSRTRRSRITTWTSTTTSPRCCSSPPPTPPKASRCRCKTAWRSSAWPATPSWRSSRSPRSTWCPSSSSRTA
jgi:Lon protease-like protein